MKARLLSAAAAVCALVTIAPANAARHLELTYGGGGAGMLQLWPDGKFLGQDELAAPVGDIARGPLNNGWNMGQYIAHIGPQRVFVLPQGVLNGHGANTLALAVTSDGAPQNKIEPVHLTLLRNGRGGIEVHPVAANPLPTQHERKP